MIEIKRASVDLARKHLKQVSNYAINAGCEWILLTNGKDWQLYHVSFGKPPETKHIYSWNILTNDIALLAERFELISFRSVARGALDSLWQKANVLSPRNLLQAVLSEESIKTIRRVVRRESDVPVSPEDLVAGVRRLLNEAALAEMETIRIVLGNNKKQVRRRRKASAPEPEKQKPEVPPRSDTPRTLTQPQQPQP
jgi:predicted type IV restriction endonuclease